MPLLFYRKLDFYILIYVTSKIRPNGNECVDASASVALRRNFGDRRSVTCRDNARICIFNDDLKPKKVSQADLFFGS